MKDHEPTLHSGRERLVPSRPGAPCGTRPVPEVPADDSPRRELPRSVRFGAFEFTYLDGMRYQARSRSRRGEHHITDLQERSCSCPGWSPRRGHCAHLLSLTIALTRTTGASVK